MPLKLEIIWKTLGVLIFLYSLTWWRGVYTFIKRGGPPHQATALRTLVLTQTGVGMFLGAAYWAVFCAIIFFKLANRFVSFIHNRLGPYRPSAIFIYIIGHAIILSVFCYLRSDSNVHLSLWILGGAIVGIIFSGLLKGVALAAEMQMPNRWYFLLSVPLRPHTGIKEIKELENIRLEMGMDHKSFARAIADSPWGLRNWICSEFDSLKMGNPEISNTLIYREILKSGGLLNNLSDLEGERFRSVENLADFVKFTIDICNARNSGDHQNFQKLFSKLDEIGLHPLYRDYL